MASRGRRQPAHRGLAGFRISSCSEENRPGRSVKPSWRARLPSCGLVRRCDGWRRSPRPLGYTALGHRRDEAARTELVFRGGGVGSDVRYLANFLVGIEGAGAPRDGRCDGGVRGSPRGPAAFESASLALAALELQRGDAERACARAREPFAERPGDRSLAPVPLRLSPVPRSWPKLRAQVTR